MARTPTKPTQPELPIPKPRKAKAPKAEKPAKPEKALKVEKPKKASAPLAAHDEAGKFKHPFVVFGDLHVSAKTLDRACETLRRVGEVAQENSAIIVCTGDFWHQRASLSVRQLDAVLAVFREWKAAGLHAVIVPGNHDQVSVDGHVHAVQVFEAFENVTVATEPFVWPAEKVAFIPWREEAGKQDELFAALEGDSWTVFTHAEIEGATTNHAHTAKGRVSLDRIREKARAVYAGHYHKRQQLGDRAWYLGSPFEMDMGERDEPHGIALVTPETTVPTFLDFDDMPKHMRVEWPEEADKLDAARVQDIVEIVMSPEDMHGPAFSAAVARSKATDVRTVPTKPSSTDGAPAFALSLEAAIEEWAHTAGFDDEHDHVNFVNAARALLAEVADSRVIVPFAPVVRILSASITNFCAVRGTVEWSLAERGPMLLQGAMGSGKTSLCDAITWCFFDTTTPRKATGGTLKADDVVHDAAEAAGVTVEVELVTGDERRRVSITRMKKRGKGSKTKIVGIDEAEGIADQQALIHRVVGMDVDLWRACVYLGQGEVENFVVSADKKRKELLSRAFSLSACDGALKITRERAKKAVQDRQTAEMHVSTNRAALDALEGTDFSGQAAAWDAQSKAKSDALATVIAEEYERIAQVEPHLAQEAQWLASRNAYDAHVDTLTKALATSTTEVRTGQVNASLGGAHSERGMLLRQLEQAKARYARLASEAGSSCEKCGQPIDAERRSIQSYEAEQEVTTLTAQITTLDHRIANWNYELGELRAGGDSGKAALQAQIEEAREALRKCSDALTTLGRLRETKSSAERRILEAQNEANMLLTAVNPFTQKAVEVAGKIASHKEALALAEQTVRERAAHVAFFNKADDMFSPKGLPVLVLRTVLYELETQANRFLAQLLGGRIHCRLDMKDDDLDIHWFEWSQEKMGYVERSFLQLSGGQRRCAELAFSPFALSEMIFARCGVRVPFLIVDELTTHLDALAKPIVCELLRQIDRETVIVIDHDVGVRGEFDTAFEVRQTPGNTSIEIAGSIIA